MKKVAITDTAFATLIDGVKNSTNNWQVVIPARGEEE